MPVGTVKLAWRAISFPWSQVSERRSASGKVVMCAATAAATESAVLPPGSATIMQNRVVRSARVGDRVGEAPGRAADDQVAFPVTGNGPVGGLAQAVR